MEGLHQIVIEVERYKEIEKYERDTKDRIRWPNRYVTGILQGGRCGGGGEE